MAKSNQQVVPGQLRTRHEKLHPAAVATNRSLPGWDRLLFVTVMLFSFGDWVLLGRSTDATNGSAFVNVFWGVASIAAILALLAKEKGTLRLFSLYKTPLLLLGLVVLSVLWSDDPEATARRSFQMVGTTALGFYFGARLGPRGFVEALAAVLGIGAVSSGVLIAFFPELGTMSFYDGAWAGFFNHKNHLGQAMDLAAITALCLLGTSRGPWRLIHIASIPIFLALLIGSHNAEGLAIAAIMTIVIPFLLWCRCKEFRGAVVVGGLVWGIMLVIASISGFAQEEVLSVLGKDSTFSGRTELWELVVDAIRQRPLFGYGYGYFWGATGPAETMVYPLINWVPGSAHNGFLEVALYLGLLGEGLLILLLLVGLWRASAMFWQGDDLLSAWPLLVMIYTILVNLGDATLLKYDLADAIVYFAAYTIATERLEDRNQAGQRAAQELFQGSIRAS